jgi:hypothetical protein
MNWEQLVSNVIVPVGAALILGGGGILAVKMMARRFDRDWHRKDWHRAGR